MTKIPPWQNAQYYSGPAHSTSPSTQSPAKTASLESQPLPSASPQRGGSLDFGQLDLLIHAFISALTRSNVPMPHPEATKAEQPASGAAHQDSINKATTASGPTPATASPPDKSITPTDDGTGMNRSGPLQTVQGGVYGSDPLSAFRNPASAVNPANSPNVLSNPYRSDGLALSTGYKIPPGFNGKAPVYTEGNNWPVVGPNQPQPPYPDLQGDTGVQFKDGKPQASGPLTQPGESGAVVENALNDKGVLITAGSYPGNEQPGQAMTPVNPGQSKPLPIPPEGWYNNRTPEVYASVGGLDPKDAVGWHSAVRPDGKDYGTPGFAYNMSSKYSDVGGKSYLFGGFGLNEGYLPSVSKDPGYGMALYTKDASGKEQLAAVTDLQTTGDKSAKQDLWARPEFNPQRNAQGGLSAFPSVPKGETLVYKLVSHDQAQSLLAQQGNVLHNTYEG